MKYISTRGSGVVVTSTEAIKNGLAKDGGLYVPVNLPIISLQAIDEYKDKTYAERAAFILGKFLTDYSPEELEKITKTVYNKERFGTNSVAPIYNIDDNRYVLELWHGPTAAFKDMALQVLPHLLVAAMEKTFDAREVFILAATSGDTGKAAMAGFKDVDNTKIWTFYPAHGVSDIQKLQMTTQEGENVRVCAINGNFDDAQSAVKKIFSDSMYRDAMSRRGFLLSSANSINWGRLAPQVAYYFSAYCELVKNHEIELGQPINFVVPTGNFGNILAGYYAKIMGVPIHKLICASNENNVLTEFFRTGKYNANREFHVTASPSMDILVSSNLERLIFELLGRDGEAVAELMDMLKKTGFYAITESQVGELYENFWADCCDDVETAEAIAKTYREGNYVIDPHTATAVCVYDKYKEKTADTTKTVIVSTASPFKFADFVVEAIFGQKCFDSFESIKYLVENGDLSAPSHITQLNEKEIRFADVRDKEEIKSFVDEQFV